MFTRKTGNYKRVNDFSGRFPVKWFLIPCMLLTFHFGAMGQRSPLKTVEQALQNMLNAHNADTLKSVLSPGFSVGPYSMPSAFGCLKNIADKFEYEQVRVRIDKTDKPHVLQVVFSKKGQKDLLGHIHLDDSNQILFIDVFDRLYGMDRTAHSELVAEVPFETDDHGSVVLFVKLNNSDRVLKLLFDTGADGMALSKKLADSLGLKADLKQSTSVVGGKMDIEISRDNTVHLGGLSLAHQSIAFFNKVDSYDGIIGNTIARAFITEVNYDKQTISFYNFGDYAEKNNSAATGHVVDVTMPSGVIIIPGQLSVTKGKTYKGDFVFDLGAGYGLICFRPFVRHNRLLVDGFKPDYSGTTTSLGMTTPTFTGQAEQFQFGNLPALNGLSVTLMSGGGQSESWNPGFDGSIGTRLISRYNFTINLQAKQIVLTPNKSFHYPPDFARSNMLFGFDVKGDLRFQNYVGIAPPANGLPMGARILSVNNIGVSQLRDHPEELKELLGEAGPSKWTIKFESTGGATGMQTMEI